MSGKMPYKKYRPYPVVRIPDRTWPDRVIRQAPVWCSVDLRDGNQALSTPMGIPQKLEMFQLLVNMGFKQIEVGFPAASQVEYDFVRKLIEEKHIPSDVTIQVMTPAREALIERTFGSIKGTRQVIVHLYNSTSRVQRRVVFKKDKPGIIRIATEAARKMVELRRTAGQPGIRFQYSPESFPGTELDFALEICQAVINVFRPTSEDPLIINLPETVEMSTPNVFADRIEWFSRRIRPRKSVIISVHTHNDRSSGVAAAELAVMAGAQRVEGALFGNGERTGNMDIVTMALNMFSHGVDPKLDLSRIDQVREVYSRCTGMTVHPRHPYAGELVFTAFSGSHQDAINKGLHAQASSKSGIWEVPYLPIDPKDIGRDYSAIIRINSQSGKGGAAHIMERDWGFSLPKEMHPDFGRVIQAQSEQKGTELSSQEIKSAFEETYLRPDGFFRLQSCSIRTGSSKAGNTRVQAVVTRGRERISMEADGNGPVDAFVRAFNKALSVRMDVVVFAEHSCTAGADAQAVAYLGIKMENGPLIFGAGIDANISRASIRAVVSALNRSRKI